MSNAIFKKNFLPTILLCILCAFLQSCGVVDAAIFGNQPAGSSSNTALLFLIQKPAPQSTNQTATVPSSQPSNSGNGDTTAPSVQISNLTDQSKVRTGFLVGTASDNVSVAKVEVSIDNSDSYVQASGTNSWIFSLPSGSNTWKSGSSHTLYVRSIDTSGNASSVSEIQVWKHKNLDVNGDGYSDFALGASGETVSSQTGVGSVYFFFGSSSFGTRTNIENANITFQGTPSSSGESFGTSIGIGDINGDGYADILISATGKTNGSASSSGSVFGFFGKSSWDQTVSEANADFVLTGSTSVSNGKFGSSVSVSDLDGDGYSDLMVGAPGETVSGQSGSGNVYVFLGKYLNSGTTGESSADWKMSGASSYANGHLGQSIDSGDTNGDGYSDLMIGAPGESVNSYSGSGAVYLIRGAASFTGNISEGSAYVKLTGSSSASNGSFGSSVAMGDIDGDGKSDAVVGAPNESVSSQGSSGNVYAFYSTDLSGGTVGESSSSFVIQGSSSSPNGNLGTAVGLADITGDGKAEILVGAPGEGPSGQSSSGAVYIFAGKSGYSGNIPESSFDGRVTGSYGSPGGLLGKCVDGADTNSDGILDVLAGAPSEAVNGQSSSGNVYVYYGSSSYFYTATKSELSASIGIAGSSSDQNGQLGIAIQ